MTYENFQPDDIYEGIIPEGYDIPIANIPVVMGRVVGEALAQHDNTILRNEITTHITDADGAIAVGDLLQVVQDTKGSDALVATSRELWSMVQEGRIVLIDSSDSQRIIAMLKQTNQNT